MRPRRPRGVLEFELPNLGRSMRRREFISLVGGTAVTFSFAAQAQQSEKIRRVGILMGSGPSLRVNVTAFLTRLDELGWKSGRNLRTDIHWWSGDAEQMRTVAADMLVEPPDVLVAFTNLALALLKPLAGNVPIVFVGVGDPVGSGFVNSLAQPGGNITGFASYDGPMGSKWLEVLKESVPQVTRVMAILHPETPVHNAFWKSIEAAAPRLAVQATPGGVHDAPEIERKISSFAVNGNAGLIVLPHALTAANRELIIELANGHHLPTIFAEEVALTAGALIFHGIDFIDNFAHVADYVDRVLRGAKPAELPVQAPIKFKLGYNLKTARAMGLDIPPIMLSRADEVIE